MIYCRMCGFDAVGIYTSSYQKNADGIVNPTGYSFYCEKHMKKREKDGLK